MIANLGPGYTYAADQPHLLERCIVEVFHDSQTSEVWHFEREAGDPYMEIRSVFEPGFDADTVRVGKNSDLQEAALTWLQDHYTGGE